MDVPGLDKMTTLLTEFLNVQSRRAQVVAGNLANADTPGYIAQEVEFSGYLNQAADVALKPGVANQNQTAQSTASLRVIPQNNRLPGLDGNNVDTGQEMVTLSEAGTKFLSGTTMMQSRLRLLRAAIREGR